MYLRSIILLWLALAAPFLAAGQDVRKIADILSAIDRAPVDPARLQRAHEALTAPPPPGLEGSALADYHIGRARAANELGLVGPRIAELRRALELGGGSQPHVVWAALSSAELRGGNFRLAIEARTKAKEEADEDREGFLRSQHVQLAKLYLKIGDLEAARRHMSEAEALLQRLSKKPAWRGFRFQWQYEVEDGFGQLESAVGRHLKAEARYRRALDLVGKAIEVAAERAARRGREERSSTGLENQRDWVEVHLAGALRAQDRLHEAEFHARNAAYRAIARSGEDSMHVAEMLGPLSQVLRAQRRGKEALALVDHGLRKFEILGVPPTAYGHVVFRRLRADALTTMGLWKEALVEFEAMQAALAGDPQLADTLGAPTLGWIRALTVTGRSAEALDLAVRLEARMTERMGANAYAVAEVRGYRGAALAALDRDAEALAALRSAVAVMIPMTGELDRSGARFNRFAYIILNYLAVLARVRGTETEKESRIDAANEAFVAADVLRGMRVQQAMMATARRAAAGNPKLAQMVREEQDADEERDALYRILADLLSRPAEELLPKAVEQIRARAEALDRQHKALQQKIRRDYPDYADLVRPRPVGIQDIQTVLRPGEAMLAVGFTELGAYVWAIPAEGKPQYATVPLKRSEIRKLAERIRATLDVSSSDPKRLPPFDAEAARRLHDELLAPVAAGWRGAKHLFVATGTNLSQIPFALLLTGAPPPVADEGLPNAHYTGWPWLIRHAAISQLPSASSLVTLRRVRPGASGRRAFAGFGDPEFSREQRTAAPVERGMLRALPLPDEYYRQEVREEGPPYEHIAPLPETREEILELARALKADPARDVFLGPAASRENVFAAALEQRRVIAFATHGLLAGEFPGVDQPALALANPGGGRHGLLTLDDILGLRLDADWVVLSACNTGGGDGDVAEALSGLGRSFFYAGSRSLLITHWRVESTSAKDLVVGTFGAMAKDPALIRAEALRRSMLDVLDSTERANGQTFSRAHPFFWAPFALVGDGGG